MRVNLFLTGDAVATAKKGQRPPQGYYNLENMLKDLIEHDVKFIACRTCIGARGLSDKELIDGVQIGTTLGDLAKWVKESENGPIVLESETSSYSRLQPTVCA